MRILIVSDNISIKMGGEASLPFYYFKLFRARGIDVHCLCHARVSSEIEQTLSPEEYARFSFIKDTSYQTAISKFGQNFPPRIDFIIAQGIYFSTMIRARVVSRRCIAQQNIDLIFEPAPITPKGLSFMYGLKVPVVIGPLCGGLEFPPAFAYMDSRVARITFQMARFFSAVCHRIIPGKLQADALVVANQRTEDALPKGTRGKIYHVVESGVDLDIWAGAAKIDRSCDPVIRFVFAGRFVDWKGVKFLVEAFIKIAKKSSVVLELIGDGELRSKLEAQVQQANLQGQQVRFHGWLSRQESSNLIRECHVFVMPSLRECGGTAILEAMALGLPVIVTNWCGPAQYVTPECGFRIDPRSSEGFVSGLAEAMSALAESPDLRRTMGEAGQRRVRTEYFDWESKADRMLEIFGEVVT
jgi:glycosyltransferase involved in cell wall biosynthesis